MAVPTSPELGRPENNMSTSIPTMRLFERAERGGEVSDASVAQELLPRWRAAFDTSVSIRSTGPVFVHFTTDLSDLRIRGLGELGVVVVLTNAPGELSKVNEGVRRARAPGRLVLVAILSPHVFPFAGRILKRDDVLLVSGEQLRQLLNTPDAPRELRKLIHQQIPAQRLNPYNHLLPATGGMFFGRSAELDRLLYDDDESFVIPGPSRIGKTSLIQQYRRTLVRSQDPRAAAVRYVSFFECKDQSPNGVARHLAMEIDGSRRSARLEAADISRFLQHQRSVWGSALELLLDEVDEVCNSQAFTFLTQAARSGMCRLIMCGRGNLLRLTLSPASPVMGQLEVMRLEPLDRTAARELLLTPLDSLDIRVDDPEQTCNRIIGITGGLPHLIQFYGKRLASSALSRTDRRLTMAAVSELPSRSAYAQWLSGPLSNDSLTPRTRLVALSLLREHATEWSVADVQDVTGRAGIDLSHTEALSTCYDLVIANILIWRGDKFTPANGGLLQDARHLNFLDRAYSEARRAALKPNGSHR
jgi:hypothetical protein